MSGNECQEVEVELNRRQLDWLELVGECLNHEEFWESQVEIQVNEEVLL